MEELRLENRARQVQPEPPTGDKKDKKKRTFFERLFKKNKLLKPNKVAVIYLKNTGAAEVMELETKKGFFSIQGKTYHEDRDCTYTVSRERIPLAIIPEWSLIPLGTKRWEEKPMLVKFSELQDHAIRGIRNAELVRMGDRDRGKLNGKAIVGLIIALIVGIALFMGFM